MDEFEAELRINRLERSYQIASDALSRARNTLQLLRSDATLAPALIARAEQRCEELIRRKESLRFALDEVETQSEPGRRIRAAKLVSRLHASATSDQSD